MHYRNELRLSFDSLSHILRDVSGGWLLRRLHANGASFFFLALFAHTGRGVYYGSYIFIGPWFIGGLLLFLVIGAAFLGYVLPWGQISYWGATVITNLLSAVPYIGSDLVYWLWGGFSVSNPTLIRFFTLHFLVPFLITGLVTLHVFVLHHTGSNNPLGINSSADKIAFHRYYLYQDLFGFVLILTLLLSIVFFCPLLLMEVENFIPANPLITPVHIVPEWYFLFAYSILRTITSKVGGVFAMLCSMLILFSLPLTHIQSMKGLAYYGPVKILFWLFVSDFLLLTISGTWPVVEPFISVSCFLTVTYFRFFFVLGPSRYFWDKIVL